MPTDNTTVATAAVQTQSAASSVPDFAQLMSNPEVAQAARKALDDRKTQLETELEKINAERVWVETVAGGETPVEAPPAKRGPGRPKGSTNNNQGQKAPQSSGHVGRPSDPNSLPNRTKDLLRKKPNQTVSEMRAALKVAKAPGFSVMVSRLVKAGDLRITGGTHGSQTYDIIRTKK